MRYYAVVFALLALPAAALGFHFPPAPLPPSCSQLTSPTAAIDLAPNQVIEVPVFGPGCSVTDVTSLTPNVFSVEKLTYTSSGNAITSVTLRALSPGVGELNIQAVSNGPRLFRALVTVDDCSENGHTITMPPAITVYPRTVVPLQAETHGYFNGRFDWFVGGVYVGSGTSTLYTTSDTGSWDVTLRSASVCGPIEAHTTLTVIPSRAHAARH